jgi:hypothetical protein
MQHQTPQPQPGGVSVNGMNGVGGQIVQLNPTQQHPGMEPGMQNAFAMDRATSGVQSQMGLAQRNNHDL